LPQHYMGTYKGQKKAETRMNAGLRPDQWLKVRASASRVGK
jgi:hypothetical protein